MATIKKAEGFWTLVPSNDLKGHLYCLRNDKSEASEVSIPLEFSCFSVDFESLCHNCKYIICKVQQAF